MGVFATGERNDAQARFSTFRSDLPVTPISGPRAVHLGGPLNVAFARADGRTLHPSNRSGSRRATTPTRFRARNLFPEAGVGGGSVPPV
jgi:hypothetical protein